MGYFKFELEDREGKRATKYRSVNVFAVVVRISNKKDKKIDVWVWSILQLRD